MDIRRTHYQKMTSLFDGSTHIAIVMADRVNTALVLRLLEGRDQPYFTRISKSKIDCIQFV